MNLPDERSADSPAKDETLPMLNGMSPRWLKCHNLIHEASATALLWTVTPTDSAASAQEASDIERATQAALKAFSDVYRQVSLANAGRQIDQIFSADE